VTQIGKIVLLTAFAAMAGCATHAMRCDDHLQPINAPRPKPAKGPEAAPSVDAAPAVAPLAPAASEASGP
jgi:hypothetical protein